MFDVSTKKTPRSITGTASVFVIVPPTLALVENTLVASSVTIVGALNTYPEL